MSHVRDWFARENKLRFYDAEIMQAELDNYFNYCNFYCYSTEERRHYNKSDWQQREQQIATTGKSDAQREQSEQSRQLYIRQTVGLYHRDHHSLEETAEIAYGDLSTYLPKLTFAKVLATARLDLATEKHRISPYDDPDYQTLSHLDQAAERQIIELAANKAAALWPAMATADQQDYVLLAYGYGLVSRADYNVSPATAQQTAARLMLGQQALCRLLRWQLRKQAATQSVQAP
jgi:hypothetical protein